MNKYLAFYNNDRKEVEAETSYQAQQKAIELFKPTKSKRHLVHVVLCELADGTQIVHSTSSI